MTPLEFSLYPRNRNCIFEQPSNSLCAYSNSLCAFEQLLRFLTAVPED